MLRGIALVSVTGNSEHQILFMASLKVSPRHDIGRSVCGGFAAGAEEWKESTPEGFCWTQHRTRAEDRDLGCVCALCAG